MAKLSLDTTIGGHDVYHIGNQPTHSMGLFSTKGLYSENLNRSTYGAFLTGSSTDQEVVLGLSTNKGVSTQNYIRLGIDKLEYTTNNLTHSIYHSGKKPTAADIGALPVSDNKITVPVTFDGMVSDDRHKGFLVKGVYSGYTDLVVMTSDDDMCYFGQWTHTGASTNHLVCLGKKYGFTYYDGKHHSIYHEGYKPTAADIGALSSTGKAVNSDKLDGINSSSFLRSDANDNKTSGYLRFNDNILCQFGSSGDAELFCNGSHFYLDLNGGIANFYIRDGSTTRFTFDDAGHFTATGNVTAYSDIRLKMNIKSMSDALSRVMKLDGITYNRIDLNDKSRYYGGISAQQVEKVLPEAVSRVDGDTLSLDYHAVVGLLVNAIKTLKQEVEQLKGQVNNFKTPR